MDRDLLPEIEREHAGVERTPDPRATPERPWAARERELVIGRGCLWRISPAERQTMFEVGRFRTVAVEDLLRHRYHGNGADLREDLRSLQAQGLVQRRTAWIGGRRGKLDVLVLTRRGKEFLEGRDLASAQALYSGFVKPSEVAHDAAIYRMFQAESARIVAQGGTIRRVVLDYELKKCVYAPLAKVRVLPASEYAKRQAAVAESNGLRVVHGKIPLPDLRIEYQTRDGTSAQVDLELATHHYHGSHLAAKAAAGFTFYAAEGSAARLTRVMEEREITAAIFAL
ncbi:MAG TPA: hypothetical protein VHI99_05480 [Vicinamibacterales bacterium]|jgi:hypothetical protein|nr:hypothetical protein [Vicinamibacterales bacterium]